MINYQKDLNEEQLKVVLNGDGPCLVLAGAGSGKTRTITYRVAYLLEKGINPENILLLTFTNRAANEMVNRVSQITKLQATSYKLQAGLPWAGTFHSIANKILRRYAKVLGYQNNFTILDADDSKSLIKLCVKEFKPDQINKFPSANIIQGILSYSKNSGDNLEKTIELKCPHFAEFLPEFEKISAKYESLKKESNAMDFDDLLINLNLLLKTNTPLDPLSRGENFPFPAGQQMPDEELEGVGKKFAQQFQYILVDEYQDTNKIQAEIIKKLASVHQNILVVGDDAQSIYSFRAAQIENILNFEKEYQNTKIFKLTTNYRSSQEILDVANDIIANNLSQYQKKLKALGKTGLKPSLHPQSSQEEEAQFILGKLLDLENEGIGLKNIAVLFRAAHHSQRLEMELVKAGIEYDYRGGMRFFERAHIKDVLAYLRILNNLNDRTAWLRVLTHEEGIGPAAAELIVLNTLNVLNVEDVKQIGFNVLPLRAKQGWQNFVNIWESLLDSSPDTLCRGQNDKVEVAKLIRALKKSNYAEYLQNEYMDSRERLQDIEQLAMFAEKYNSLDEFLSEATLQENYSHEPIANSQPKKNKLILSTVHQAKGLEWDAVFIINLTSNGFPNERAATTQEGLEEERRLFYVATTRARKHLFLTYPAEQSGWGERINEPSTFLAEISQDKIEDHSFLKTVLNDLDDDLGNIKYVEDYQYKPGSFLKDIDDL